MNPCARAMAAALLAAVATTACAARTLPETAPAARAAAVVRDLRSVYDLAAAFDRDREHPRIVLLLSPT